VVCGTDVINNDDDDDDNNKKKKKKKKDGMGGACHTHGTGEKHV
jgi:hypothetical protein